jgi:hypothetical protein
MSETKKKLNVHITDRVYVMGQGYGSVTKVLPEGGFVVNVPGRGEAHYTAEGTVGAGGDVRIFFEDPVIVIPSKNTRLWQAFKKTAAALYGELVKLDNEGELPDD